MKDSGKTTKSSQKRQSSSAVPPGKGGKKPATGRGDKPVRKKDGNTSGKYYRKNTKKPVADVAKIPTDSQSELKPERIAKRIARAGLCSRREAEAWILDGRVSINGELLDSPARTVTLDDKVEVDGNPLPGRERTRLWLYHKPSGLLSTNHDPEGRPTIFEKFPKDLPRMLSVGRLDMSTEGLLLMTNDGGLARILELPATGWLRRYRVRAYGKVDQDKLDGLKDGIAVDGILYGSIEAIVEREQGSNTWLLVSIREGKNREVKNVLGAIGLEVNRLIRVSYGPFQLGELGAGQIQEIRGRTLRDQLGERLIREAGADFDAPIIHHAAPAPGADGGQKKDKGKTAGDPQKKKTPRGAIAIGTMERLGTKREPAPGYNKNRKSGGKSPMKFKRKPK